MNKRGDSEILNSTKLTRKNMVFSYMQKVGRSLMIPVAILPAAAILMGIGYWLDPTGWGANNILAAFMIKSGSAIIDNMSLLFAVGIAFGMSVDKNGSAALTGLVGFLVVTTLLSPGSVALLQHIDISAVPAAFGKIDNQFIGILVGIISAELYNRYHKVQLHKALAFFSGKRIVPIIMSFVMIGLSFVLLYVWPVIFNGLVHFGESVQGLGAWGAGIFGFTNRLLIPLGLHHALNSVFWFDVAGINDIPNFLAGAKTIAEQGEGVIGKVGIYQAGFFPIMMFGLLGAALAFVKTSKPENRAKVTSIMMAAGFASFFTGVTEPLEFAFMFLAPPLYFLHAVFSGLSLGIAAHMQWISGFGFSAGLIDLILSAKNPLAKDWYMLIVQGLFFFVLYYVSFTFCILKFKMKTPGREDDDNGIVLVSDDHKKAAEKILPLIGGLENIVSINNCISRVRLQVKDTAIIKEAGLEKIIPGVLVLDKTTLHLVIGTQAPSISDAITLTVTGTQGTAATEAAANDPLTTKPIEKIKIDSHADLAAAILVYLGGKENVVTVDNCITRLRLDVVDSTLIDKKAITKITAGVLVPSKTAVQVIVGTEVEFVATELHKLV
jgi:PTS system N-acetylglucosamine-specific IIC component